MSIWRLPSPSIRAISYVLTENTVAVALAAFIFFRVNRWLGLFVILVFVSAELPTIVLNMDGSLNRETTAAVKQSALWTRNAVMVGVLWYTIVTLAIKKSMVPIVMDAICIIALVNVAVVFWQYYTPDVRIGEQSFKTLSLFGWKLTMLSGVGMSGLLGNPNTTSGLFAMCLPLFFRRRWMLGDVALLPLLSIYCFIALMMTKSSNGVAALALGGLFAGAFYAIKYRWVFRWVWNYIRIPAIVKWTVIAFALFLSALFTDFILGWYLTHIDMPGIQGRWDIWQAGWVMFAERPIRGLGLGHWKHFTGHLHAHNDIWQAVYEMGIGAGVLMAGYMATMLMKVNSDNIQLQTALVVIAANAFIAFPLHIPTTAMVAVTILALLTVKVRKDVTT
jgi:hypothetical protein